MITPLSSWAQDTVDSRTYGTNFVTVHTLSSWAFTGLGGPDNAAAMATTQLARFCASPCVVMAPLTLPAGALLHNFIIHGCDTHPTGVLTARLLRKPFADGDFVEIISRTTQSTNGCATLGIFINPAVEIDNAHHSDFVLVSLTGGDDRVRFSAAQVWYSLQVSPAPAVATFDDVPTNHPFFPFVETLVATGITTGCNLRIRSAFQTDFALSMLAGHGRLRASPRRTSPLVDSGLLTAGDGW